jgi:hypothetical protein
MPWRPIFQLVDHRLRCLGHDPNRVRENLAGAVPLSPAGWAELVTRRRPVAVPRRPARIAAKAP